MPRVFFCIKQCFGAGAGLPRAAWKNFPSARSSLAGQRGRALGWETAPQQGGCSERVGNSTRSVFLLSQNYVMWLSIRSSVPFLALWFSGTCAAVVGVLKVGAGKSICVV